METVFLACSFHPDDRQLVDQVQRQIESHGLRVRTGRALGGASLTHEVRKRIEASDALVALMTPRIEKSDEWPSSAWVRDEFIAARTMCKPAIAMIEASVPRSGSYHENEYILLDRAAPLEAFLSLSETIRTWRETLGRVVEVRLLPEELGRLDSEGPNGLVCRSRLRNEDENTATPWQEVQFFPEPGGVILLARGVRDRQRMQVRLCTRSGEEVWVSKFEPYRMHAMLDRKGTGT